MQTSTIKKSKRKFKVGKSKRKFKVGDILEYSYGFFDPEESEGRFVGLEGNWSTLGKILEINRKEVVLHWEDEDWKSSTWDYIDLGHRSVYYLGATQTCLE